MYPSVFDSRRRQWDANQSSASLRELSFGPTAHSLPSVIISTECQPCFHSLALSLLWQEGKRRIPTGGFSRFPISLCLPTAVAQPPALAVPGAEHTRLVCETVQASPVQGSNTEHTRPGQQEKIQLCCLSKRDKNIHFPFFFLSQNRETQSAARLSWHNVIPATVKHVSPFPSFQQTPWKS